MDRLDETLNGFERHGISHLSASSINTWTNAPDVWVARYLLKKKTSFGPAPARGIAVEQAVVHTLMGESESAAIQKALDKFDEEFLARTPEVEKERNAIVPMTQIAIEELVEFGRPEFPEGTDQEKITITAKTDTWSIPLIGYLDLVFPQHGTVVDLKTTNRIPSTMSREHQVQRAIYAKAKGNHRVAFLYVSSQKARWLEDGDPTDILGQVKQQVIRLEAFLRHHTAETARDTVPVNPGSFYWRGDEELRREIYGV